MDDMTTISAEPDSISAYCRKLWKYRSLIVTFSKRDLKIKYAQTYFGILWVLLQSIPLVLLFTFFFDKLIHLETGVLPYPIFALTGMVGWLYFMNLANGIGNSLVDAQHILKKIYFPKIILPLSKVLTAGVDFIVSIFVLIVAMSIFRITPSYTILFFLLFFLLNILAGFAIGIWVSALTFRFRDLQHVAPFILNLGIWLTPVFYPATVLPQQANFLMYFNPMATVVAGYRFSLAGDIAPDYRFLASVALTIILLVTGLLYFRKVEDEIVDVV
jgi:lipopolysaccharide transport system permease protein